MKTRLKRKNFYQVSGWMILDYNLKGNELILYAIIYGFSQDKNSSFQGTASYLAELGNMSKRTVMQTLKNLVEKGLLNKIEKEVNGVLLYDYKALTPDAENDIAELSPPMQNLHTPPMQNLHTPHAEFAHPLDNNKDNDSLDKEKKKINKEDYALYILFNSLFKNKFGLDFQPTKAKNKTYHINALKKLNEIHGEDLPGFLEACLNIKNTFLQKYLNPAEILDKHSDFVINLNQEGTFPKAPEKSQPPKIKLNKPKPGPDYQELAVEGYKKFMKMYKDYTRQEYIARNYAPFDTIKIIKEMYLKRVDPLKFLNECFKTVNQEERLDIEPGFVKDNGKKFEHLLQKCLIK